jgi:hypothetical protein
MVYGAWFPDNRSESETVVSGGFIDLGLEAF